MYSVIDNRIHQGEWDVLHVFFVTKVLVIDMHLIKKVLYVLDVFQVLWVLELVRVGKYEKYLYLTQVLQKILATT